MEQIDPRIIRLSIDVGGGKTKIYEGLNISATGTKYGNANQNECEVKISNLDKTTRDYILTETTPYNNVKKKKRIILEAGRLSYGVTKIFEGDVTAAGVSQPPDITITLKTLTGANMKGKVGSKSYPKNASLKTIAAGVAKNNGLTLQYEAKDKTIVNHSYSGSALKEVDSLGETGGVNAYVDDGNLVVKDYNVPLNGKKRILNAETGMIGIPEVTELGVKVKFLLDNYTTVGTALEIKSELYKAVNGLYCIYKLGFDIANRDTNFYWIAEAKRI